MMNVPLAQWTRITVTGQTIFLADRPSLARQGLAGARSDELGDGAIYFLVTEAEGDFDNEDHGYGLVNFDIKIAFLDSDGTVLAINSMPARTGRASPPHRTSQAIEAKPEWFDDMGFCVGEKSPVRVHFLPHKAHDRNDCYFSLCTT